jgi:uncharacterized membrane protein
MNYNPYAAPQAPPPQQPQNAQGGMPQPWEIGEVLAQAWTAFKANWVVYVVALVVSSVFAGGPGQSPRILGLAPGTTAYFGASGGGSFVGIVVGAFLRTGFIRINLAAARGQTPVLADLFSGGPLFLRMLGLQLLLLFAYGAGCSLFIVGAFFVMLIFCLSDYFVVDANMGVIDSMRASYEATKGQWGNLLLFGLVVFGMMTAGLAACCVGIFVAAPVATIAMAIIFTRITGRGAIAPAAPPYPQQPPPGYGPPGAGYGPPPGGGGYGGPPAGGGGYPPPGGGGYGPPPGGGGYSGPPGGGGGYGGPPPGGGGGYGPPG